MRHPWSARCLLALLALPLASACDSSTTPPPPSEDSAAPSTRATPAGGQYSARVTVSLLCDDAGGSGCAATHYTLDGSEPTRASPAFRDALALSASTTLKFFSVDGAGNTEAVRTEQYTFGPPTGGDTRAPTTRATPAGGEYTTAPTVTLACDDADGGGCAATHFTTDGSEPTVQSARYASPFSVPLPTTLRFFSVDRAGNAEPVQTQTYTAPPSPTSQQLAAVRAQPDSSPISQPITRALVTSVKPGVGSATSDVEGFFLQDEPRGPALFVLASEPLSPPLQAGDRVSLVATEKRTVNGQARVTNFIDFVRHSRGESVAPLLTAASAVDLVARLNDYESEYLAVSGTLTSVFSGSGTGHMQASLSTLGVPSSPDLKLRLTTPVLEALQTQANLAPGCAVTVTAPLWRFNAVAQPSAWALSDIQVLSCPGPKVTEALAQSSTSVVVRFDRDLQAFTFTNGLAATGATVLGRREVRVDTTAQGNGQPYTVTVAGTVRDLLGAGMDPAGSSRAFTGLRLPALLRLSEVAPNISLGRDLVELSVVRGGPVGGMKLVWDDQALVLATLPDVQVATGDVIVVHLNPDLATGSADAPASELSGKGQYPVSRHAANFDTAWDFHGGTSGLSNANVVVRVKDAVGNTQDAAAFIRPTQSQNPFPFHLQTLQSEGFWQPASCTGQPCTYFSSPTAWDVSVNWLEANLSDRTEHSGQGLTAHRVGSGDTDSKGDWAVGGHSLGRPNP
jgi:hypothetical protein